MDATICEFLDSFEPGIVVVRESADGQCQVEEQEEFPDANLPIEYPEEEGDAHGAEVLTMQFLEQPVTQYAEGRQFAWHRQKTNLLLT